MVLLFSTLSACGTALNEIQYNNNPAEFCSDKPDHKLCEDWEPLDIDPPTAWDLQQMEDRRREEWSACMALYNSVETCESLGY